VIEVDRSRLMALVQTDSELSDILMRAFILRRLEIDRPRSTDLVLLGSSHSAGTLRIKEFLIRNAQPMTYIDLEQDADVEDLLDRFQVSVADVPVVIVGGRTVLHNPTNERIAECVGLNAPVDSAQGAGRGDRGRGTCGARCRRLRRIRRPRRSRCRVERAWRAGGREFQDRELPRFPAGISGQDLAGRAYSQAQKFGAQVIVAKKARALLCKRRPFAVELEDGSSVAARTIVIATGAFYRKLAVPDLAHFEGVGVYYAATAMEAHLCRGEEVIVVGGGNSAGQAAVFLAQSVRRVHMLVRAGGLAETMSRYLIRRIEQSPSIELRTSTEIVALEGGDRPRGRVLEGQSYDGGRAPRGGPRVCDDGSGARHAMARGLRRFR
jgi:thioredoxin reductase (NADPH)